MVCSQATPDTNKQKPHALKASKICRDIPSVVAATQRKASPVLMHLRARFSRPVVAAAAVAVVEVAVPRVVRLVEPLVERLHNSKKNV